MLLTIVFRIPEMLCLLSMYERGMDCHDLPLQGASNAFSGAHPNRRSLFAGSDDAAVQGLKMYVMVIAQG